MAVAQNLDGSDDDSEVDEECDESQNQHDDHEGEGHPAIACAFEER